MQQQTNLQCVKPDAAGLELAGEADADGCTADARMGPPGVLTPALHEMRSERQPHACALPETLVGPIQQGSPSVGKVLGRLAT